MADYTRTLAHLKGAALGVFGAGHLGRVIATGLARNGFPISRLFVCHGGSSETAARIAEAGLAERIVEPAELTRHSRIILYLVRPQHLDAIRSCELISESLIISFLAGTTLARLPIPQAHTHRVRVMTSAPDTIMQRKAICGVYPGSNSVVEELLTALGIERIPVDKENDLHAFTALGVCLPIVLACWRALGGVVNGDELIHCAQTHGVRNYETILEWARIVEPQFETPAAREDYIRKAATPGGVTEAIIQCLGAGGRLTEALESGIRRSEELSRGSSE